MFSEHFFHILVHNSHRIEEFATIFCAGHQIVHHVPHVVHHVKHTIVHVVGWFQTAQGVVRVEETIVEEEAA